MKKRTTKSREQQILESEKIAIAAVTLFILCLAFAAVNALIEALI